MYVSRQVHRLIRQFRDLTELLDLYMRADLETSAFILNDQLGRGRSSTTAVIVLLIQRWLRRDREQSSEQPLAKGEDGHARARSTAAMSKTSWQIINSCLRVIRNGLEVKRVSPLTIKAIS